MFAWRCDACLFIKWFSIFKIPKTRSRTLCANRSFNSHTAVLKCLGLPKLFSFFGVCVSVVFYSVLFICFCMVWDVNGLRGCVDEDLYRRFVVLYRGGVPVSVIRVRLGVGSSVYYKLFQLGLSRGDIVSRYRRRG